MQEGGFAATWARLRKITRPVRPILERVLTIDAHYLPALYAYALTKPTHELRMGALKQLASVDSENAEPYYLMAVELFTHYTAGRHVSEASDFNAFDLTQAQWRSISDLINKGNNGLCWNGAGLACHPRKMSGCLQKAPCGRRQPWLR